MKKSLFLIIVLSIFTLVAEGPFWYSDYEAAEKVAVEKNMPLFLFFSGSDWCPWCRKLEKRILEKPAFYKELEGKVVFVLVDFPMKSTLVECVMEQNQNLMKKYNVEGFPTIVLVDPEKGVITKMGYLPLGPKEYAECINEMIEDFYSLDRELQSPDSLSIGQWERLASRAKILGSPYYNEKLQNAGIKSCPSPLFLIERYEVVLKEQGLESKEASKLKSKIEQLDPQDVYRSHYKMALLEFYSLTELEGKKATSVVFPLVTYIQNFGQKNPHLWRIHLMIAHYLFSKNEVKDALYHAKMSFKLAPEKIRKELADTIASFKEK